MANLTGSRSTFPNQLDSFREIADLLPSKKVQAKRYQELKMKEVLSPAEVSELNSLMTELQDFIVTPEYTNKMLDALINLESFFLNETVGFVNTKQTEMNSYVDTKKTEMQTEINKFDNKGTFNISIQYYKNNFVDFNDGSSNQTYICLQDCVGKEPSSNPLFWRKLTIQGQKGDKGDAGANFVYKGSWVNTTTYMIDEAVTYGGNLFVSKIGNNVGFEPSLSSDTSQWFKAMDISIVSKDMIGTRTLSSQSNYVNFMTDEITTFNSSLDSLSVYMNSVRLTKGVDYTINPNNQVINKINGTWDGTSENPIFFEFVVRKNVNNDIIFKDGTTLQNGSVTRNKLDVDTQTEINKINTIVNNVGIGTLETSSQKIIPAINELHTELDLKVNTVDINDILTPQGILDKVKQVDGTGSGLDADLLDGKHATDFSLSSHTHAVATQAEVDAGISNTLYVTPLGLAGLKQSVVNGKQQVVNAINDSVGYVSGLTTNNTHADYAWWIQNKVAPFGNLFDLVSKPVFIDGLKTSFCSSVTGTSYSIVGSEIRGLDFTINFDTTKLVGKSIFMKVIEASIASSATLTINSTNSFNKPFISTFNDSSNRNNNSSHNVLFANDNLKVGYYLISPINSYPIMNIIFNGTGASSGGIRIELCVL